MKKYHTLLVVAITVIIIALLTWFLPITYMSNGELIESDKVQAGIMSVGTYSLYSFYNFVYVFVYLLFIGGLYGVLNRCSAYRVLLDKIVGHVKKFKLLYLILTVLLISVIVSFTGYTYEALIFLPLIASIVLLLGYDRITAALVTVGSISTGIIGSIFGKLIVGKLNSVLGSTTYSDYVIPKIIVLGLSVAVLVFFIVLYTKKKSEKENIEEGFLIPKKVSSKNVKVWPLVTILVVFIIMFTLAGIDWSNAFKVSFFSETLSKVNSWPVFSKYIVLTVSGLIVLYNVLISLLKKKKEKTTQFMSKCRKIVTIIFGVIAFLALLKIMLEDVFKATDFMNKALEAIKVDSFIKDFTFSKLLGSTVAFGSWTYNEFIVLLMLLILAIKLTYRVKVADAIASVGEGFKKVLYGAVVVVLSYTVLMMLSYHPIGLTIIKPLLNMTEGLNVFTYSLATLFSALCNSDFLYHEYGVLSVAYATTAYTGSGALQFVEFITQTMYGFAMYFAPTSVILLFTLSLLDIKYTTWLKKIWLLLLMMLVVIILVYLAIYFKLIV